MGRPKTIFVDPEALLAGIVRVKGERLAQLDAEISAAEAEDNRHPGGYAMRRTIHGMQLEKESILRDGIAYRIEEIVGRPLSDSERVRHTQAIRQLEREGKLIVRGIRGTHLKLT